MSNNLDFSSVLHRLSIVLDEEVKALSGKHFGDLSQIIDRKARCLLEISRIVKLMPAEGWITLKTDVQQVLDLLHANERTLAVHLEAATALGEIIKEVLIDQLSDGTYIDTRRAIR